jgi:alkanesulfonate monooxygenase SsuD/methylene tetrahydromethanopterin reductase-like flavin-dependent oxidoreductase (luciferase family)
VKFGLHYLLSCSDTQSPTQRYRDTLEQAIHAEALGFESVWPAEQHFNQRICALPCPALLLAAIASRTSTLRLGTAIVQLPLAHPMRIAEEIATLDVLSGGRVEFGVGRGANPLHYKNLGVAIEEGRERMVEALDYVQAAFTQERFTFEGRFFQASDACLVPKPQQQPHPPIHIAANSVETLEFAGRKGCPVLVAAHLNPFDRLGQLLPRYQAARTAAGHETASGDDLTIMVPMYVDASPGETRRWAEPAVQAYAESLSTMLAAAAAQLPEGSDRSKAQAIAMRARKTTYDDMNGGGMAIFGTPEECLERLARLRDTLNPGRVIAWFDFMGAIPHEQVMRSMELFSSKVLHCL